MHCVNVYLFLLVCLYSTANAVTVKLPFGDVQGFHADYGTDQSKLYYGNADVFLGIPYVKPPLHELRFAKPQPLTKFSQSPWNATYYRSPCPQIGKCTRMDTPSEDCLYLNVFSPNVNTTTKYAVMVFIHGGSFCSGCAQEYPYKGATRTLVSPTADSPGIVVVTIQYRIGFWGFFTTLTDDFPANRGLLDQVEALIWVKNNIAAFGGDPARITIFGESAGSASVSAHTYSPLSRGLFQQVIQESGGALTCFSDNTQSAIQAKALCGISPANFVQKNFGNLKACIANLTADQMLTNGVSWDMVYDNYFLNDTFETLGPKRPNYPTIIANMRDEYEYFILNSMHEGILFLSNFTEQFVKQTFYGDHAYMGDKIDNVFMLLKDTYFKGSDSNDFMAWMIFASQIYTGDIFPAKIIKDIDYYLLNGNKHVYVWDQNYAGMIGQIYALNSTWNPVPHCAELYYIWVPEDEWTRRQDAKQITDFDWKLLNAYGYQWTYFANYGNVSLPGWVAMTSDNYEYISIEKDANVPRYSWRTKDIITWNQVVPSILNFPSAACNKTDDTSASHKSIIMMPQLVLIVYVYSLIL